MFPSLKLIKISKVFALSGLVLATLLSLLIAAIYINITTYSADNSAEAAFGGVNNPFQNSLNNYYAYNNVTSGVYHANSITSNIGENDTDNVNISNNTETSLAISNNYIFKAFPTEVEISSYLTSIGMDTYTVSDMLYFGSFCKNANIVYSNLSQSQLSQNSRIVFIDINSQCLYGIENGEIKFSTATTTGRPGYDTPTGDFAIYAKQADTRLISPFTTDKNHKDYYDLAVDYWMPFYGGYGLHDAKWRTYFGGDVYKYSGSHGCVNQTDASAKVLWNFTYIGTPVIIR